MLTGRNPYDPIEIQLPPFWQCVKAGAAFTLGAGLTSGIAAVLGFVIFITIFGTLGALITR